MHLDSGCGARGHQTTNVYGVAYAQADQFTYCANVQICPRLIMGRDIHNHLLCVRVRRFHLHRCGNLHKVPKQVTGVQLQRQNGSNLPRQQCKFQQLACFCDFLSFSCEAPGQYPASDCLASGRQVSGPTVKFCVIGPLTDVFTASTLAGCLNRNAGLPNTCHPSSITEIDSKPARPGSTTDKYCPSLQAVRVTNSVPGCHVVSTYLPSSAAILTALNRKHRVTRTCKWLTTVALVLDAIHPGQLTGQKRFPGVQVRP